MSPQAIDTDRVHSRRDLAMLAFAGLATPPWSGSGGATLGVHASSFQDVPAAPGDDAVDRVIRAMTICEARECELSPSVVEPAGYRGHAAGHHESMSSMTPQMMRRELRKWRLRAPLGFFESIGARFASAGIRVYAYNYSPDATFTDEEIDRGFSMARALGADVLTVATTEPIAERIGRYADKHRMVVALDAGAPTTVRSPFKLQVDVARLLAANVDPVAYVRAHHEEITSLYLTDCRTGSSDAVRWGEGDAPIREVLQLLKREGWPIHAYVKYQHRGGGAVVDEVKRCVAYAKQAMA
jgi:sugar phosphate isomerase/epimerase